jgi:hypothetical protein
MNDDDTNGTDSRPAEAVRALRARGIDNAEELLQFGTPEQILTACHRWDGRRGVGPGLLAGWVRMRQFAEPEPQPKQSRAEILRARFDEYARRFPEGSIVEPHAQMQARRWPDEPLCPGQMVVWSTTYPNIAVECDRCGLVAAYPVRSLASVWANYHQPPEEVF